MVIVASSMSYFLGIVYAFFILIFLSSNSLVMYWLLTELNLILFIVMIHKFKPGLRFNKFSLLLFYFVVQSLGRIVLIIRFCFIESGESFYKWILIAGVVLKIGLWPLHSWFFLFSLNLSSFFFFLIVRIQKFPGIILLFSLNFEILVLTLTLRIVFGCFFLFQSVDLFKALACSSLYSRFWFYLFFLHSLINFFMFFIVYVISIFLVCIMKDVFNIYKRFTLIFILISCLIFLSGLPPFSMFFFKFRLIENLYNFINRTIWLSLWGFSFLALIGYFKNLYFVMLRNYYFYSVSTKNRLVNLMFFIIFFFFPMTLAL